MISKYSIEVRHSVYNFLKGLPASLKDEELWFSREVRASGVVELLQDPLVGDLLAVTPQDVAVATVTQNHNHNHLGLKREHILYKYKTSLKDDKAAAHLFVVWRFGEFENLLSQIECRHVCLDSDFETEVG